MQRKRVILRDNIQGIRKPALRRICEKGSEKRIGSLVYNELRARLKVFLENIIRGSIIYMEHARSHTLTTKFIQSALDQFSNKTYDLEQEQLVFPYVPFARLIREITQDYSDRWYDVRFSKPANILLQDAAERYLQDIVACASGFASGKTITERHIQIASRASVYLQQYHFTISEDAEASASKKYLKTFASTITYRTLKNDAIEPLNVCIGSFVKAIFDMMAHVDDGNVEKAVQHLGGLVYDSVDDVKDCSLEEIDKKIRQLKKRMEKEGKIFVPLEGFYFDCQIIPKKVFEDLCPKGVSEHSIRLIQVVGNNIVRVVLELADDVARINQKEIITGKDITHVLDAINIFADYNVY